MTFGGVIAAALWAVPFHRPVSMTKMGEGRHTACQGADYGSGVGAGQRTGAGIPADFLMVVMSAEIKPLPKACGAILFCH